MLRHKKSPPRVGFVSLGCPKATVDSEHILTRLRAEGYVISSSYQQADLVVVNTCGFIDAAVEESLDAIGEALAENGKVIVTGCLGAKGDIVRKTHPTVLAVTGPHAADEVMRRCTRICRRPHDPYTDLVPPQGVRLTPAAFRLPENFRRLQPSLHLLHHPFHAWRSGEPADGRGMQEAERPGQVRGEGTPGDFAGHQRLWRGREIPHRLLAWPPAEDPHDRTGARRSAGWACGCACITSIPIRMWMKSFR